MRNLIVKAIDEGAKYRAPVDEDAGPEKLFV
ncbi:hypothetical protein ABH968_003081 [Lysinibacillus sp. RC79]